MTVLEEEVRGKFRQGGGHESTEEWGGRGKGRVVSWISLLEYTKRSSWLARLLPLYDYLAIFTADHRSLSQSRIKNLLRIRKLVGVISRSSSVSM